MNSSTGGLSQPAAQPAPRRIRPSKDEDWEPFKEEITQIYWNDDKTLHDVMGIMAVRHGFYATEKQYKRVFQMWKLEKKINSKVMQAITDIQAKRREQGKETQFTHRGRDVPQGKIDRWRRKQHEKAAEEEVTLPDSSSAASTPSAIGVMTPEAPASPAPTQNSPKPHQVPIPQQDQSDQSTIQTASPVPPAQIVINPSCPSQPPPPHHFHGAYPLPPQQTYQPYPGPTAPIPSLGDLPGPAYDGHHVPASRPYGGSLPAGYRINPSPPPPPLTLQSFGPGAPPGSAFQYSKCTGRRRALLIGINYLGQRGQLAGCINDVTNMLAYLTGYFGYKREHVVVLTDDQQRPTGQPTKQNILRAMHWLVEDARPDDSLFFHFSGHGGQTEDPDGDKDDGYNEVIYPVDFRQAGYIKDDDMHRIMVQPLQAGVRLTCIFDSCHSVAALELPYTYSHQGIIREPNFARKAGHESLGVIPSHLQGNLANLVTNLTSLFKKVTTGEGGSSRTLAAEISPADVIMFSANGGDQALFDHSMATGAISWAFIRALKKNPRQNFAQLMVSMLGELAARSAVKPRLSCSHPIDAKFLFIM